MKRIGLWILATVVLCTVGCQSEGSSEKEQSAPDQADSAPGVVNIYSARHYDTDESLFAAFEEETGIEVQRIEASGDALLERLKAEGDSSPCDILLTVDAGRLQAAEVAGLFQPTKSSVLEQRIPAHLRHPEGYWFGFSTRARCIFYDRSLEDYPRTYEDLADPRWKGKVLIRSSSNVYNQSLVASMIEAHGEAETKTWAEGLVANMARTPQGGDTDQLRALAAGEGTIAVANSYYYARLMESTKPEDREVIDRVAISFPNQAGRGTHVNVSGAGITKNSPNRENALRFLEFLASDDGQERFAAQNNEFPAVNGVPTDPALVNWSQNKFDSITSIHSIGGRNREALLLMDQVGWR